MLKLATMFIYHFAIIYDGEKPRTESELDDEEIQLQFIYEEVKTEITNDIFGTLFSMSRDDFISKLSQKQFSKYLNPKEL